MQIYKDNRKGILRSRLKHTNHYLSDVIVNIVNTNYGLLRNKDIDINIYFSMT